MEGVDEKARRWVQGDAVRCRTEDWKADEASIAREGRGILRIGAAVLRWSSLTSARGQHWKCSIETAKTPHDWPISAVELPRQHMYTQVYTAICMSEHTSTKSSVHIAMRFWYYSLSPANRLASHADPFSSYSALLTSTSFSSSGRLANCAAPSQVCLMGSSARDMFSR